MRILLALVLLLAACGSGDAEYEIDGYVDCESPRDVVLDAPAPAGGGPSARAAVVAAIPALEDLEITEHWYGHVSGAQGGREVISATAAPEQDGRWYILEYDACPGF